MAQLKQKRETGIQFNTTFPKDVTNGLLKMTKDKCVGSVQELLRIIAAEKLKENGYLKR